MNKKNQKLKKIIKSPLLITISLTIVIFCIGISVVATSYLFNSNAVSYNNGFTEIKSDNVQGAVDELYQHAIDNNNMNTRITEVEEEIAELQDIISDAGFHNSIFRGKDVTSYLTAEGDDNLYARISSGKFTDLYVGDYVVINGIIWRMAGFDIYYGQGGPALTSHHAVIVPDNILANAPMNDTNTTEGGYVGSKMYTTTLPNVILPIIEGAFGSSNVLTFQSLLTTAINTTANSGIPGQMGAANNRGWYSAKVNLMNMVQVTGNIGFSPSGYDIGSDKVQFPLFKLQPEFMNKSRQYYWLRDVVSYAYFGLINSTNSSGSTGAANANGVRPYFYIG